jgi:hypothetical protein
MSDKNELIEKIDGFKNKLEDIKSLSSDPGIQKKINALESEFDIWAKSLDPKLEAKKLEIQSRDLQLEKIKIDLSRQYRNMYVFFFDVLNNLISSYNKNHSAKIEIIQEDKVPLNLYSLEAIEFREIIKFNENQYWHFQLDPHEPLKENKLPRIGLHVKEKGNPEILYMLGVHLAISIELERKEVQVKNDYGFFRKVDFIYDKNPGNYQETFRDILRQAFEYQLAVL